MHEPKAATKKSKDLVRMAVAKARLLEPLQNLELKVNQAALVVGGGVAGMTAALELAKQGFKVHLVEKRKSSEGTRRSSTTCHPGRPARVRQGDGQGGVVQPRTSRSTRRERSR